MEQPVYQLLYASAASPSLDGSEMLKILEHSREANAQRDVTGILLYCEGSIIQLLEGDEATVKSLFETIAADKRHDNVQRLYNSTNPQRQFPDWTMGYEELPANIAADLGDLEQLADHQLSPAQLNAVTAKINYLLANIQQT